MVSLDGTPESAYSASPLTVTAQPLDEMARQAVDLLFDTAAPGKNATATPIARNNCGCLA